MNRPYRDDYEAAAERARRVDDEIVLLRSQLAGVTPPRSRWRLAWGALASAILVGLLALAYARGESVGVEHARAEGAEVVRHEARKPSSLRWTREHGCIVGPNEKSCPASYAYPLTTPVRAHSDLHGVWAGERSVWAVGDEGIILRRGGDGTWAEEDSPTHRNLVGVWGAANGDVYAVGSGVILRRAATDGRWAFELEDRTWNLVRVAGSLQGDIVALGPWGILRRDEAGAWEAFYVARERSFHGIASAGHRGTAGVRIVGDQGTLLLGDTESESASFREYPRDIAYPASNAPNELRSFDLLGVWASGPMTTVVVGTGGAIARRKSDGAWRFEESGTHASLHAVSGHDPSDLYAVGGKGVLLHGDHEGSWTREEISTPANLYDVTSTTTGTWVVGEAGTILHGAVDHE